MRVAAVDLGTNSTRLLVAEVAGPTDVREVERLLTITRLGDRVDRSGTLREDAIERVLTALRGYRDRADALGVSRRLATATSAVRDAANGAAFLRRVEAETGFETRLLPGLAEARLTRLGALADRAAPAALTALIDVGGGSTEVSLDDARAVSLDVGCVRATERWLDEGTVAPEFAARAAAAIRALLDAGIPADWPQVAAGIAVAGTATTLAALDLGLDAYDPARTHGHRLTRAAIARQRARLAPLSLTEREAVGAMEPGRAPVIVGGILVLEAVLERLGLDAVTVSERDILHGIALLTAGYADV